jgi:hypothetical protein
MESLLHGKTDEEVKRLLVGVFMTPSLEAYLKKNHPSLYEKETR